MSMLVLQPRISTAIDFDGVEVGCGEAVSVGGIGELVSVGSGVSVKVGLTGTISVTPGAGEIIGVVVKMSGVAVTILGVEVGGTTQVATC
jgi:hypothetical protein